MMKSKLIALSERYAIELRAHLLKRASASLRPALELGRQAVVLGLDTLELARMHDRAFATVGPIPTQSLSVRKAEVFFTEALAPIVETHRAARHSKMELNRLTEQLGKRTAQLIFTNSQVHRGIVRRKSVEAALKKSGIHYSKLLKDSLHLQRGLRELTHQLLTAQEVERKQMSSELQDEIAQTLLGINARLLSLKQEARLNTHGLKTEIAATQRLVMKSATSVRKMARKYRNA